jgi:predicted amidophosphoribosyltransferase
MIEEPVKICSSCGAEYSLEAVTCADCGGSLVFPHEYEKRSVPLKEDDARNRSFRVFARRVRLPFPKGPPSARSAA